MKIIQGLKIYSCDKIYTIAKENFVLSVITSTSFKEGFNYQNKNTTFILKNKKIKIKNKGGAFSEIQKSFTSDPNS